ncbi:L,D-transpeptidase family protein [Pontibacter sp. FD36]|uniref:L,D-transpeptidase family protein n=1 Tax=Pontibacter sp. FD36 TaxID=2789860 RepID=UPI0018A9FD59|nr:L,D-transpeptidase family protein [Pontibacter sp. FD36]MBF8963002.1 L,D-transpeptidase family protein [Pontibacter sp. FD36]
MTRKKIISFIAVAAFIGASVYYFYPEQKLPAGTKIDKLLVLKSERKLLAYADGQLIKTYTIALGRSPVGHKEYEGDKKTPQGLYTINDKNPNSAYHKNLGISYPNTDDIKHARTLGKSPGGAIKIHGLQNGTGFISKFHRFFNSWTLGCIAVTDEEMDELYDAVPIGTPIEIRP